MKTDPSRSIGRRELESQLAHAVLDVMHCPNTPSFVIITGDTDPARAHYLKVGKFDQIRERLAGIAGAGSGADVDGHGATRH